MYSRKEAQKAEADRAFIRMVQGMTSLDALLVLLKNYQHKAAPEWKRVIIFRRMRKLAGA